MARIYADRVLETTTTTGTGNLVLAGASAGYQAFAAVAAVGDTFDYAVYAVNSSGAPTEAWETGSGTLATGGQIVRAPSESSNAGALVNFAAGTKIVVLTETAASLAALAAGGGGGGGSAPPYRYYIITQMFSTISSGALCFAQLTAKDATGTALTISVITSNTQYDGSTTAANLIDGDDSTVWASGNNSPSEQLHLDMGASVLVASFGLRSRSGGNATQMPNRFQVWGSADGSSFALIAGADNETPTLELTTYNFPLTRLDA